MGGRGGGPLWTVEVVHIFAQLSSALFVMLGSLAEC